MLHPRCASPALVTLFALCACGGGGGGQSSVGLPVIATPAPAHAPRYVIVIVQENRSVDNLFQGFPGADTQRWGLAPGGRHVPLVPAALNAPFGVNHDHTTFVMEYDDGKMDGFANLHGGCGARCKPMPYTYVRPSDVKPYWALAQQFALADEVLQSNEGSSFAAHQYLIAGQSGHPWAMSGIPVGPPHTAGCSVPPSHVMHIDMRTPYPGVFGNISNACENYATIFDFLEEAGLSWRYYTPYPAYVYNAPFAVGHIFFGRAAQNDVSPEFTILSDIQTHHLANVSYLVSRMQLSDHPQLTGPDGPNWIATITNAVFGDRFYSQRTVVLVTWDDWGGWYDHVPPRHPAGLPTDPYEYGFRVPLLVASRFVRQAHEVDHTPRDQTAILHFIETLFGLPSLGQLDAKTDDLFGMFDFTRSPLPYMEIDTGNFKPQDLSKYPLVPGQD